MYRPERSKRSFRQRSTKKTRENLLPMRNWPHFSKKKAILSLVEPWPNTGNNWQKVQDYNISNDWTWGTTVADVGHSTIWVFARLQGSNETYASAFISYEIDDGNQAPVPTLLTLDVQQNTDRQSYLTATDPEGDALTFSLSSTPTQGNLIAFDGLTGLFVYRPNNGYSGADGFDYRVTDSANNSVTQTLTINVVSTNTPPVAIASVLSVQPGVSSTATLQASDVDGDTLTYAWVSGPSNGVLTGPDSSTGEFSYIANAGFAGEDSFRFSVDDGAAVSTATVTITVAEEETAAITSSLTSPQSSGTTVTIQASANNLTNPEYEFWLTGPATGGAWSRVQSFSSNATWDWNTSGADVGLSTIWVYSREAGTVKVSSSESINFVVN